MNIEEQQTESERADQLKQKAFFWLRALLGTAMIFVVLLAGIITLLFTVESATLKPIVERIVTLATGRAFVLEGQFEAEFGRLIAARADAVKMANAAGSSEPYMLIITPVLLAALLTAGVTVLFDIPLNFANVIALPLLFGMGVDNGIHIVHRYRFGTLTTVFSFGNLAISPHVGMASMGQLLTIGMLLTMVTTLILLPAMLAGRPAK
jgi:type IV secretory pathway VirB6-like protein